MIHFNNDKEFIITAKGDSGEYIATMRAIINLVKQRNKDFSEDEEIYYAMSLLEDMLPDEKQLDKLKEIS